MSRRLTALALLFGAGAVALLAARPDPAAGQGKGAPPQPPQPPQPNVAAQQVQQLQIQVQKLALSEAALRQQVAILQGENQKLQAAVVAQGKKEKPDDKAAKTAAAFDGMKYAGLVHVVLLKAKSDTPGGEAQSVIDDAYAQLGKIKAVRGLWAGKPSAQGSPAFVSKEYTVALVLLFDNPIALKNYHDDPLHDQFAARHLKKWDTPVVYDFEPKKQ